MTGPYAAAAWDYRAAGWKGVIPIGRRPLQKAPPPSGYTGYAGLDPSGPDVQTWIDGPEGTFNIGLHLPPGVYVLDVDERNGGLAGLAELEARAGVRLPATVTSTAHSPASVSRHHFFRAVLPEGRVWRDHPAQGLDSLHVGHRYAVVAPSVHPVTGTLYAWYGVEGLPRPGDLAELPAALIEACSQPGEVLEGSAVGDAETLDVIQRFRAGPLCPRVAKLLYRELDRMTQADQQALHSPGPLYALTAYGIEGHAGVAFALSQHQAAHVDARTRVRGEGAGGASAEWWRMVRGAAGKKLSATGGAIITECGCGSGGSGGLAGDPLILPVPTGYPQPVDNDGDYDPFQQAAAVIAGMRDQGEVLSYARQVARAVVAAGLTPGDLQEWRGWLKREAGLNLGDFDACVKAHAAEVKAAQQAQAQAEREKRAEQRRGEGSELPHRSSPMPVARELFRRFALQGRHLRRWQGDWYGWRGTHYERLDDGTVRSALYIATEGCWYEDAEQGPQDWNPDTPAVNKVLDAFGHGPAFRATEQPDERCIALANGVLDMHTWQLMAHTPERFNLAALPYDYDPMAVCPQWLAFLGEVIPDPESQLLLQQWFGYLLSGRTDLQKILSLFGASRSGKGTILRVLDAFTGMHNVATVTLSTLAGQFGRQSLIGKSLMQITDANWRIRDIDIAVETLKAISGEDSAGVPRKNQDDWQGTLAARIVLLANDEPKFNDPSGALLNRMIHIEFTRSFLGREDEGLTGRLLTELPGIFNWAVSGLMSITAMGRLVVPAASRAAAEEIELTTNPVAGFLRAACGFTDPASCVAVYLDDLHAAFTRWAFQAGRFRPAERDVFARDLRSAARGRFTARRVWVGTGPDRKQVQAIFGIELLSVAHSDATVTPLLGGG